MMERFKRIWQKIKEGFVAILKMKVRARRRFYATIIALLLSYALIHLYWPKGSSAMEVVDVPLISYSQFLDKAKAGEIKEIRIGLVEVIIVLKDEKMLKTKVDSRFANPIAKLHEQQVNVVFDEVPLDPASGGTGNFVPLLIMVIVGVWVYFFFWGIGPRGEIYLKFWQSRSGRYRVDEERITFDDVAGVDEVKTELKEIVDFLKNPKGFQRLGGRIPKGVLLIGPPGTGKTLIARAVAGEAGVPFHFMSGSDFVQMYVGVGAMRVRALFDKAKADTPCIVYIDEIDSLGSKRSLLVSGGDREYQQTTNALLTELDGFDKHLGIVFLASTNNPENLDEALLRPGRLDRNIMVLLPDAKGREAILKIHTKKIPLAANVDLATIALGTPGFSGADLANIANEAAIFASRERPPIKKVSMSHFALAKDKVMMGPERKSLIVTDEEKWRTAFHEVGHAFVALRTMGADPVEKVSIMPRGKSLGVTIQLPQANRHHYTKSFLTARIVIMMGGRATEDLFFEGNVSAGAEADIEEATRLASNMVCRWGMSDLGPFALKKQAVGEFLGRGNAGSYDCSSDLAFRADEEIKQLLTNALQEAGRIIENERDTVKFVAGELFRRTELSGTDIQQLLESRGESMFKK